jgi:hypothetical protein
MREEERMSYFVKREPREEFSSGGRRLTLGYTGPIRTAKQAAKEAEAWVSAGWKAWVLESSSEVRAEVRSWAKARKVQA